MTNADLTTSVQHAEKVRVLVDIKLEADIPDYLLRWNQTQEERIRVLERWIKEFHEFIRDHRSQDPVRLRVERIYEDQCSLCHAEWEPTSIEGELSCANCGELVCQT